MSSRMLPAVGVHGTDGQRLLVGAYPHGQYLHCYHATATVSNTATHHKVSTNCTALCLDLHCGSYNRGNVFYTVGFLAHATLLATLLKHQGFPLLKKLLQARQVFLRHDRI
eukprot:2547611-Rhodomonas_salina.1